MMNIADMVRETLEDEAVAELCFETKKEIKALLRACTAERIAEACVHLAVSLFLEFGLEGFALDVVGGGWGSFEMNNLEEFTELFDYIIGVGY